jgi:hypothetical protein
MKNFGAVPRHRYVVFKAVLLPLLLIACSKQVQDSPRLASEARLQGEMLSFEALGTLYTTDSLEQAMKAGSIGYSAEKAIVPLIFNSEGNLLRPHELGVLANAKRAGKFNNLDDIEGLKNTLSKLGLSYYLADFTTYKLAMQELALDGRLSLNSYKPLRKELTNLIPKNYTRPAFHLFVPYKPILPANAFLQGVEPTGRECLEVGFASPVNLTKFNQHTNLGETRLNADLDDTPENLFSPYQSRTNCQANCLSLLTGCLAGCTVLINPVAAAICGVACSAAWGVCYSSC